MSVEVGSTVEGKVVSIMPFGAFVSLPDGKTGLVHISEIAPDYVKNVSDHLTENQTVRVKVVSIDPKGKISLSIKRVLLEERRHKQRPAGEPVRPSNIDWQAIKSQNTEMSFEDKLSRFKMDSDEKMQALRRSSDSKRSGGYKRSSNNYY